jgi:hypothetical protein
VDVAYEDASYIEKHPFGTGRDGLPDVPNALGGAKPYPEPRI